METDDNKDLVAHARDALTKAKGMHDKEAKVGMTEVAAWYDALERTTGKYRRSRMDGDGQQ